MDLQLRGQVVMVVGATGGIGSAVADLVLFLASPRTGAVNGAIIPVDGGSSEGLY